VSSGKEAWDEAIATPARSNAKQMVRFIIVGGSLSAVRGQGARTTKKKKEDAPTDLTRIDQSARMHGHVMMLSDV
jgi:hypothetical protein